MANILPREKEEVKTAVTFLPPQEEFPINTNAEQILLFPTNENKRNGSGFIDPSFAANKRLPIHRWVPWVAGFSCDFVRDVIDRYLPKKGLILDPFSGVGTTLENHRRNR